MDLPRLLALAGLALLLGSALPGLVPDAAAHEGDVLHLRVEAHDDATGSYWFETNVTGSTRNPDIPLRPGTTVHVLYVNEGTDGHSLHIGGPIDEGTDVIGTQQERTFTFQMPWDPPDRFEYWCDPHKGLGMRGDVVADTSNGPANHDPTLDVATPADGATVGGTVQVAGTTGDADGDDVVVEVRIPGDLEQWTRVGEGDDWSYDWDTSDLEEGDWTVQVLARDQHGSTTRVDRDVAVDHDAANRAPNVTIDAPEPGAAVRGLVDVAGTAEDPDGDPVTVHVRVPDAGTGWHPTDGNATWTYSWNTTGLADGEHQLEARARDPAGAVTLANRTVVVTNADPNRGPNVTIATPADGATVNGTVEVGGTAEDPDGDPVTVHVRVPDAGTGWHPTDGNATWTYAWDTTILPAGEHVLQARATDPFGTDTVANVTVTVAHPEDADASEDRPPRVVVRTPAADAVVRGTVTVAGSASDPDGDLLRVEARLPGTPGEWTLLGEAAGNLTFEHPWNTTPRPEGAVDLRVRAVAGELDAVVERRVLVRDPPGDRVPTVAIHDPPPGIEVDGSVLIEVAAYDPDPGDRVQAVEVRAPGLDGWTPARPAGDLWVLRWDPTRLTPGEATVEVRAFDEDRASDPVERTVVVPGEDGEAPARTAPRVELVGPAERTVEEALEVRVQVHDPRVEAPPLDVALRVDGHVVDDALLDEPGETVLRWFPGEDATGDHAATVVAQDGRMRSNVVDLALTVASPGDDAGVEGAGTADVPTVGAAVVMGLLAAAASATRRPRS